MSDDTARTRQVVAFVTETRRSSRRLSDDRVGANIAASDDLDGQPLPVDHAGEAHNMASTGAGKPRS